MPKRQRRNGRIKKWITEQAEEEDFLIDFNKWNHNNEHLLNIKA